MAIKIWNGSSWVTANDVGIYDGAEWDAIDYGKIWNGTSWVTFYTRIVVQAPTITHSLTATSITWNVIQADAVQFAAFPSAFQYYTIRPNGTRTPSTGYSTSTSRIVPAITMSGLYQDQDGTMYYRLDYGGGTYYPAGGTFLASTESTNAIPLTVPNVVAQSVTTSSITYSIDKLNADFYSYYLYQGATLISFQTNQTASTKQFTGLNQSTSYQLTVTSHYTTARATEETITGPAVTATTNAIAVEFPTITFTGAGYNSMSFSVDKNLADSYDYSFIRSSTNTVLATGSGVTLSNLSFASNFNYTMYQDTGYKLSVTANYLTGFNPDQFRTTISSTYFTDAVPTAAPGITLTASTTTSLSFSLDLNGADYYQYILYIAGTATYAPGGAPNDSETATSISFTGLSSSTSYDLYISSRYSTYFESVYTVTDHLVATTDTPVPPPAPTITNLSRTFKTIQWFVTLSGSAQSYQAQVGTTAGGSNILNASGLTNDTVYVNNLSTGTLYYARVRGYDPFSGLFSAWVSISRSTLAPTNPSASGTAIRALGRRYLNYSVNAGSGDLFSYVLVRVSSGAVITSDTVSGSITAISIGDAPITLAASTQYRFYYSATVVDDPSFRIPQFATGTYTTWPSVLLTTTT